MWSFLMKYSGRCLRAPGNASLSTPDRLDKVYGQQTQGIADNVSRPWSVSLQSCAGAETSQKRLVDVSRASLPRIATKQGWPWRGPPRSVRVITWPITGPSIDPAPRGSSRLFFDIHTTNCHHFIPSTYALHTRHAPSLITSSQFKPACAGCGRPAGRSFVSNPMQLISRKTTAGCHGHRQRSGRAVGSPFRNPAARPLFCPRLTFYPSIPPAPFIPRSRPILATLDPAACRACCHVSSC
jgi:hypothetical protein